MGRQRNNPEMKGKEEASERMIPEKEGSELSDTGFKAMVIRKLNELSENYQKLQGNYEELTKSYVSVKKDRENYQQEPRGNEEYNFQIE